MGGRGSEVGGGLVSSFSFDQAEQNELIGLIYGVNV